MSEGFEVYEYSHSEVFWSFIIELRDLRKRAPSGFDGLQFQIATKFPIKKGHTIAYRDS